jgi:hypothetical protein
VSELTGGTEDQLRASDADRDRTIEVLNDGLVIGQLTSDEHARRVQDALVAKTIHDLNALVSDLQRPDQVTTNPRHQGRVVVAVCTLVASGVALFLIFGGSNPPASTKRPEGLMRRQMVASSRLNRRSQGVSVGLWRQTT